MKYTSDQLIESIMSTHEISCTRCDKIDTEMNNDDYDAAVGFFEDGWRQTSTHTYCPSCAKKYLSQKSIVKRK